MENPRAEKVAVVDDVRRRLSQADGVVLTEYRGLDVQAMAQLRRALRDAGGEVKIYKNTLVRLAARDLDLDLEEMLVGPTAIAFVPPAADGRPGDAAAVAKALQDFARTHEELVLKGGLLGSSRLGAHEVEALAALPAKDVLLAQLAGAFQAPMVKTAQLLQAVPARFAYAMRALIEAGGAPGAPPARPAADEGPTSDESPAVDENPTPDDNPIPDENPVTAPSDEAGTGPEPQES